VLSAFASGLDAATDAEALGQFEEDLAYALTRWREGRGDPILLTLDRAHDAERIIASGAYGLVVVASRRDDGVRTAVKLRPLRGDDEAMLTLTMREAVALTTIRHSNVVKIFWAGRVEVALEHRVVPCIAIQMELLDGISLREWLQRPSVTLQQRYAALVRVGEALDAVHRASMVHRDVKPDNIVVTRDGRVVLCDFGFAREVDGSLKRPAIRDGVPTRTSTLMSANASGQGVIRGTFEYAAPEVLAGNNATPMSDTWSYAVMAWEVLTGHKPSVEDTGLVLPGRWWARFTTAPGPVARILEQGLDLQPLQRPRTVGEIVRTLKEWGPEGEARVRRRWSRIYGSVGVTVLVLGFPVFARPLIWVIDELWRAILGVTLSGVFGIGR
jgi:serine/threonine protein kinase